MRKIEILSTDYEWKIYVDGKLFYCIDDTMLCENAVSNTAYAENYFLFNVTYEGIKYTATHYMAAMREDLEEDFNLTEQEQIMLKDMLIETWVKYFNVND